MRVRIVKREGGARAYAALCDGAGVPLPNQLQTVLTCEVGELPTITVQFVIDGDRIELVP